MDDIDWELAWRVHAATVRNLDAGDNPRALDNFALQSACTVGDLAQVDRLLALGLGLDEVRANYNKILRLTCRFGHVDVLKRFISIGLTIDDVRADKCDALYAACMHGHPEVVEEFIALGLTIDDVRLQDTLALYVVCSRNQPGIFDMFIELGLTVGDAQACNNRAMRSAYASGSSIMVARLLELGVAPDAGALRCLMGLPYVAADAAEAELNSILYGDSGRVPPAIDEFSLWRAIKSWVGSPELSAAERMLSPAEAAAWAKAKERACSYRPRAWQSAK